MSSRARKCSCICIFHFASFFHFLLTLLLCTLTLFRAAVGTFCTHTEIQRESKEEGERVWREMLRMWRHIILLMRWLQNAVDLSLGNGQWQARMVQEGSGRGTEQSASQQNALPGRSKGIFRIHWILKHNNKALKICHVPNGAEGTSSTHKYTYKHTQNTHNTHWHTQHSHTLAACCKRSSTSLKIVLKIQETFPRCS